MKIEEVTKVVVIDFDGTLIDTLDPIIGKKIWLEKTGKPWPHIGWWSKPESLDINILPIKPFVDIESIYRTESSNPNTFVSLCTGRVVKLTNEVNHVLNAFDFHFDEVILNGHASYSGKGLDGDTLAFKIRYLDNLQKRFPNLKMIEFWDDRLEHESTFIQWGKLQKTPVKFNFVHR